MSFAQAEISTACTACNQTVRKSLFELGNARALQVSQKVVVPYSIETRRGFPQSVADLRRVRINAASNVFVMQPDGNTMATPKGQSSGRLATLTELNAIKTATALHVSAMSGPHMDQKMVIQDSGSPFKTVGYMERFQECAIQQPAHIAVNLQHRLGLRALMRPEGVKPPRYTRFSLIGAMAVNWA